MIDLKKERLSTAMERPQILCSRYNSISLKVRRLSSDNFLPFGHTPEQRATKSPIQKESLRKLKGFWLLNRIYNKQQLPSCENSLRKSGGFLPFLRIYIRGAF